MDEADVSSFARIVCVNERKALPPLSETESKSANQHTVPSANDQGKDRDKVSQDIPPTAHVTDTPDPDTEVNSGPTNNDRTHNDSNESGDRNNEHQERTQIEDGTRAKQGISNGSARYDNGSNHSNVTRIDKVNNCNNSDSNHGNSNDVHGSYHGNASDDGEDTKTNDLQLHDPRSPTDQDLQLHDHTSTPTEAMLEELDKPPTYYWYV
jgi:hypothetical protein